MLREIADKKEFSRIRVLCDRCQRATGSGCLYFALPDVEQGLRAVGAEAAWLETKYGGSYKVIRCREFSPGALPAIGEG
ncbi:MAG: hypothetical protein AB1374_04865 [Bacillota bacterium]